MRSASRGNDTSQVEVSGISLHGIWLFLGDREVFLSFKQFPWFRDAPVGGVLHVERPQPDHLYWPDLDIDVSVESILHPSRYPLISRDRANQRLQRTAGPGGAKPKTTRRRPRRR